MLAPPPHPPTGRSSAPMGTAALAGRSRSVGEDKGVGFPPVGRSQTAGEDEEAAGTVLSPRGIAAPDGRSHSVGEDKGADPRGHGGAPLGAASVADPIVAPSPEILSHLEFINSILANGNGTIDNELFAIVCPRIDIREVEEFFDMSRPNPVSGKEGTWVLRKKLSSDQSDSETEDNRGDPAKGGLVRGIAI